MHLRPYLNFDGRCAEAMRFYQSVLGGELSLMRFGQFPEEMPCPAEAADRIMHARLEVDGAILMASDTMPGRPYGGMLNFGVTLAYDTVDQARRIFDKLAEGGQVGMPMTDTFWAEAFGMVTDRFGTPWLINGAMKMPA